MAGIAWRQPVVDGNQNARRVGGQRSAYAIMCVQTPAEKSACAKDQVSANLAPEKLNWKT